MFNTSVFFNNFDLSGLPCVTIYNYNVTDLPTRNLTASKLARANRSLLTSAEYSTKNVTVEGYVGGTDAADQQDNFDRLKGYVQDVEGVIRVKQGDSDVEYVGTLNGLTKEYNGPLLKVTLTFQCSNPIGKDATGRQLFSPVTITTSTLTKSFQVDGSFAAAPRFTFIINSVTGGTSKSISLLNASNSKGIRVTRTWTAGDILAINSDTFEVIVNGNPTDFSGQFPTFSPGNRSLQYIDDFTARNITLSSLYTRQYA